MPCTTCWEATCRPHTLSRANEISPNVHRTLAALIANPSRFASCSPFADGDPGIVLFSLFTYAIEALSDSAFNASLTAFSSLSCLLFSQLPFYPSSPATVCSSLCLSRVPLLPTVPRSSSSAGNTPPPPVASDNTERLATKCHMPQPHGKHARQPLL